MMVLLPPSLTFSGYPLDVLALFRIVLGLWALKYFLAFAKRPDAVLYQCKHRQLIFAFFSLEAFADLFIRAFGAAGVTLALMKEVGSFGVALAMALTSLKVIKSENVAIFAVPLSAGVVVKLASMDIDVLSLASIALVFLSVYHYPRATRILRLNPLLNSGRKFFIVSILASYVFRFIGPLLGQDLLVFEELSETFGASVALYGIRESVIRNEI